MGIAADSVSNEDLKRKLLAKFPKVDGSAFDVLVSNNGPRTSTDHMRLSLSLLKQTETTNNKELKSLLLFTSFFHGEIVEVLNKM